MPSPGELLPCARPLPISSPGITESPYDPEKEITVCCGSTEAMIASLMAIVNPGEEVIVFEPFYENYGPDTILCGASPRFVTLREPDWSFDPEELSKTFNNKTKAIILNTPNNPTGKVFSHEELKFIADLCIKWGVIAVTDEIYEHILYDGASHISLASLPGMRDQTITINSISKTYSLTGWRVGWAIAPAHLTASIRKVHDFLTVGSPHPLAGSSSPCLADGPAATIIRLAEEYRERRDFLHARSGRGRISRLPARWSLLHHDGCGTFRLPG